MTDPIGEFWTWWAAGAREQAAEAFASGDLAAVEVVGDGLSDRIAAIDQDLSFATGPGERAPWLLTVSAEEEPDLLREVADAWLAAAQGSDPLFEYDAWRRPLPDAHTTVIAIGDRRIDATRSMVLVEGSDLTLWHPEFAGLPDRSQGQATLMLLDAVLGERLMETRVGGIGWTEALPDGAVPLTAVPGRF